MRAARGAWSRDMRVVAPRVLGENRSNASAGPDQSLGCLSLAGQRQRLLERLNLRYPACMRRTAKAVIRTWIPLLRFVESRLCVERKLHQQLTGLISRRIRTNFSVRTP